MDAPAPPTTSAATVAKALVDNVAAVVLGKRDEVALVVAGLLAGGHVLLEKAATPAASWPPRVP